MYCNECFNVYNMYMKGQTSKKKSRIKNNHTRKQRGGKGTKRGRSARATQPPSQQKRGRFDRAPQTMVESSINRFLNTPSNKSVVYDSGFESSEPNTNYSNSNTNDDNILSDYHQNLGQARTPHPQYTLIPHTPPPPPPKFISQHDKVNKHARTQQPISERRPVQSTNIETIGINFETINYDYVDDLTLNAVSEEEFAASQLAVKGNLSYLMIHAIKGLVDGIYDLSMDDYVLEDDELNDLYMKTDELDISLDDIPNDIQEGGAAAEDTDNCPGLNSIITQGFNTKEDTENMSLNKYLDTQKLYKDFSHDFGSRLDEETQNGIKEVYLRLIDDINRSYTQCEPLQCFKNNVISTKSSEWTYYQSMLALLTHEDSSLYDNLEIFKTVDITQRDESNAKISEIKQILIENIDDLSNNGYVKELNKINTDTTKTYFMCDAYGKPVGDNHKFLDDSTMGTIMPDNAIRAYLLQPFLFEASPDEKRNFLRRKFTIDSKITMAGLADPATISEVPVNRTLTEIYEYERNFLREIFNDFVKLYGVSGDIIEEIYYIQTPDEERFVGIRLFENNEKYYDIYIGDTTIENITYAVENYSVDINTPGGRIHLIAEYILSRIPMPIVPINYMKETIMVGLKALGDFSQVDSSSISIELLMYQIIIL